MTKVRKVIIVGAGFAGVHAALKLANKSGFDVKLISPSSYFEYHAALYRSATGRSPLEVAIPLEDFFAYAKNVEIVQDKIIQLNTTEQKIIGESDSIYNYDELILALGNDTEFYGIKGLEKYSFGVKSVNEALRLKRHLHDHLTTQHSESSYVVVGGGATGVELAAEMMSYLRRVRKKHGLENSYFKVYLVEAADQVLGALPTKFARRVEARLKEVGVEILLSTAVESETAEDIKLPNMNIATHTVVWTAGVKNNQFFVQNDGIFKLGKLRRVEVNEHLEAYDNIYVVGDSANTKYSGMAQTALYDSSFVVNNLLRTNRGKSRQKYLSKKPVYAIPVGKRWAAVLWGDTEIYGRLGWLLRRSADLRLYLSFLPPRKALIVWHYGMLDEETCKTCRG